MEVWCRVLLLAVLLQACLVHASWFGDGDKKILLKDVQVLTLHAGKMTKGRRSSPVQQLECVSGGSAACSVFTPRTVQCINRGFDGLDVQWECKTDMDNNVRFGAIDVSCEGYDYPEDPFILAGSCGLRYNLDYTKEGAQQTHDYGYGSQGVGGGGSYGWNDNVSGTRKSSMGFFKGIADLIVYCAMGLMAWAFYKTCINPSRGRNIGDRSDSTTNDDYPTGGQGGGAGTGGGYGWNMGGGAGHGAGGYGYDGADASCRNRGNAAGPGGGGFWTGAAAGGLLGYMFGGNRGGNQGGMFGGYNRNRGYTGGGGWGGGGGGWGGGGGGFGGGGGSSGTRSASGFGGTSRR